MASIQSSASDSAIDTIDGKQARATLRPSSPEEVAEALATADREGHAIAPVGGGTKLALGNAPARLDYLLSTAALDRVLHYEPTDLTLSVQAGMRFADVQALLGERGQILPVEVSDRDRTTIGGMIATALAGPRRYGSGTLRDLLIGISVAYPSGFVAKAGGLVVKNVTGFDLMRLHLGALGTLGVIVSANFKVLPAAREEGTLLTSPGSLDDAIGAAKQAASGRMRPIAIEVFQQGDAWLAAVRLEGRPSTVEIGIEQIRRLVSTERLLAGEESRAWWSRYVESQRVSDGGENVTLRCGVAPKESGRLARRLLETLTSHDISPELCCISPGLGGAIVRFRPPEGMTTLRPLQEALLGAVETVTILTAPPALKADIDVWGRPLETVHVMRSLKSEFDPHNVLNPGRFVDKI